MGPIAWMIQVALNVTAAASKQGHRRGRREGDVMTEAEVGAMNFEDGRRGHEPRNSGNL